MRENDDLDAEEDDDRRPAPRNRRIARFASKKIAAGVCGILLGGLGVHKFILGFVTPGILMLMMTMLTAVAGLFCLFPWFVTFAIGVIGLIEGIIYLTKSDEDFYHDYAIKKREWF